MSIVKYTVLVLLSFLAINVNAVNTEPILKPTLNSNAAKSKPQANLKQNQQIPGLEWKKAPKKNSTQFPGLEWKPKNSKSSLEPISP